MKANYGFSRRGPDNVAEEVARVQRELVAYKDGQPETVRYQHINALLLNEVQRQRHVIDSLDEDRIQLEIENDLRDQIAHNIAAGVLMQTPAGEIKYSWRGMIYLWCQFLLDLVRL